MAGEYFIVSPARCNEKPWDSWVGEIGRASPRPDEEAESKGAARRAGAAKRARYPGRRLRRDAMSLHGLFPQMDELNAAVCHLCGVVVKCSAAYRHLARAHAGAELPPPPPPGRPRARHKREPAPLPEPPAPPPPPPYEPPAPPPAEVKVCMESCDLPVVSIQDTDELALGETLTDDIFAIMNSEGIQSADDIADSADWKNIIRDIGDLQDLAFAAPDAPADPYAAQDPYAVPEAYVAPESYVAPVAYSLPPPSPPAPPPAPAPTARTPSRSKTKSKFSQREYDPNKHCGVVTAENPKPCTRSLTCKAHALSLRRLVEGRAKPFDALLAEHRASRDAPGPPPAPAPAPAPAPVPVPATPAAPAPPPPLELPFDVLSAERQVEDLYASLLGVAEPPCPPEPAPQPEVAAPHEAWWYGVAPRPLAVCTYNASHAGGAVALGKRYATVRSNIKSALSRPAKAADFYGQNSLTLSKSVHMNASKSNKPEVRRLVVSCGARGWAAEPRPALNGHVAKRPLKLAKSSAGLDLAFLDPLLADEKC